MAATKRKTKFRELLMGFCSLASLLAVLVLIGFGLLMPEPRELPPEPEIIPPTLPPPPANPYGEADFQYDGQYLTCLSGDSVLGIDVSYHQREIDWEKVKASGIEFVMLRVGYRGYKTGLILEDPLARQNYEEAKAAGLKVGVYFFSQALYPSEAIEEALFTLNIIRDWKLDMPVVYDWEYVKEDARTADVDRRTLTDCTNTFCYMMEKAGFQSMVYFNSYQGRNMLHLAELIRYPFWLAQYQDSLTFPYRVDMWQYSCTGRVEGINGDVDMNLWLKYH